MTTYAPSPQTMGQNLPLADDLGTDLRMEDTIQFATFYFGRHFFGLPIEDVIEINRTLEITPVPLAPQYVAGVVNLRGQILTAVNLGTRIGLRDAQAKDTLNNVIMGRREEPISLLVERIGDVISVPKNQIEPPPELISGVDVKFVRKVCKLPGTLLIILNGHILEMPNSAVAQSA